MAWIPIQAADLQIGLYIRLDHHWSAHPFLRSVFRLNAESEIQIIRSRGLTEISYDPDRSLPEAVRAIRYKEPSNDRTVPPAMANDAHAQHEVQLAAEKSQHIWDERDELATLVATEQAYINILGHGGVMMDRIIQGDPEGLAIGEQIQHDVTSRLTDGGALSLVAGCGGDAQVRTSINTCALALNLGRTLGLSSSEMADVGQAALLHNAGLVMATREGADVGEVLTVDPQEFKAYPTRSHQILSRLSAINPTVPQIVAQHREYLDGTGFPAGLYRANIGHLARIVGVVVAYQSLTSPQPGKAFTPGQAAAYLYRKMGGKLGLDMVEPFLASVTVYPPGSLVELTDGTVGVVIRTNPAERLKPTVAIPEPGGLAHDRHIVDLTKNVGLAVARALDAMAVERSLLAFLLPRREFAYFPAVKTNGNGGTAEGVGKATSSG